MGGEVMGAVASIPCRVRSEQSARFPESALDGSGTALGRGGGGRAVRAVRQAGGWRFWAPCGALGCAQSPIPGVVVGWDGRGGLRVCPEGLV